MSDDKRVSVKIAIPTDDGKIIFPGMLGMARSFHIYEHSYPALKFIAERRNPYAESMQHLKTLDVYEIISDCRIIVSSGIGRKGRERLKKLGVRLYFKTGDLKKALSEVIKGYQNVEVEE